MPTILPREPVIHYKSPFEKAEYFICGKEIVSGDHWTNNEITIVDCPDCKKQLADWRCYLDSKGLPDHRRAKASKAITKR